MSNQQSPTETEIPSQNIPPERPVTQSEADNNFQVSQFISKVVAEMSTDHSATANPGSSLQTTPATDNVDLPDPPAKESALPSMASKPARSFTFPQGIQKNEVRVAPVAAMSTPSAPSPACEPTYSTALDSKALNADPDLKLWLKYTGFFDSSKREKLLSTFRRLAELDEEKRRFEQEKARQQADMEEKHARIMREINGHDISTMYPASYGAAALSSSFPTPVADASYSLGTSAAVPTSAQTPILSTVVTHSPPLMGSGIEVFPNIDTVSAGKVPLMTPVSETNNSGLRSQSKDGIQNLLPPASIQRSDSQGMASIKFHEAEHVAERAGFSHSLSEQAAFSELRQDTPGDGLNGRAYAAKVHRGRSPFIKREPNQAPFSYDAHDRSRSPVNRQMSMSPHGVEISFHGNSNAQRSYREREPSKMWPEDMDIDDTTSKCCVYF